MFAYAMQEHDAGDDQQQNEGGPCLPVDLALPAGPRRQRDLFGPETFQRRSAHALLEGRFDLVEDGRVGGVYLGARPFDRDARLQPGEEIGPVAAPVFEATVSRIHESPHGNRHEYVRFRAERGPVETPRGHPHDRHRMSIDDDRLVEYSRIGAEAIRPIVVAQHRHEILADGLVVPRIEQAAQGRSKAEHRKVGSGHEHSLSGRGLTGVRQVRSEAHMGRDPRESALGALEVTEHRVAEDLLAITRLAARGRARVGAGGAEVDELLRRFDRKGHQQDLIEERKDGGIRADSEAEREHRHGRHEGCLGERAQGELQLRHANLCGRQGSEKRRSGASVQGLAPVPPRWPFMLCG